MPVSERGREGGREERERTRAGRGWQNNISADSAAASGAALTFSEKSDEGVIR